MHHAHPRRLGRSLAPACALLLLVALATTGAASFSGWTSEAATITGAAAQGVAAKGAGLVSRDLLPPGGGAGILLVASGLVVLAPLTGTLLLGGALRGESSSRARPSRPRAVETAPRLARVDVPPAAYRGPRDEEFRRGRLTGARMQARSLDDLLDRLVEAEVGEPRIVRSLPNLMRVQLHACRGCALGAREGPTPDGVDGCAFECGLLEGALAEVLDARVVVHEVACRGQGAAACEFEVWY